MEWVTQKENVQHAHKTGLAKVLRGSKCGASKLDEKQVLEIKKLLSTKNNKELSGMFGVGDTTISMIRTGKNWSHLKEV